MTPDAEEAAAEIERLKAALQAQALDRDQDKSR